MGTEIRTEAYTKGPNEGQMTTRLYLAKGDKAPGAYSFRLTKNQSKMISEHIEAIQAFAQSDAAPTAAADTSLKSTAALFKKQ